MSVIRPYFSGASAYEDIQTDRLKSLGGYPSQSAVPSGTLNGLFGLISNKSINEKPIEYRCIYLRNETGSTVTNVTIEQVAESDYFTYEFLVEEINSTTQMVSRVNSYREEPLSVNSFASTFGNPLTVISSLLNEGYVALWIKRTIKDSVALDTCDELYANYIATTPTVDPTEDETEFTLSWS